MIGRSVSLHQLPFRAGGEDERSGGKNTLRRIDYVGSPIIRAIIKATEDL